MTEIFDDEFRLEFYGNVTHVVAISLEGFTGKDIVPVKRFEDHMPNSRYSNQLLSADCSDHGFARFLEKSFNSDGGVICPSAYFLFGSPEWRVDTMLEKDIDIEGDQFDPPTFSFQHDFGFASPGLLELLPEISSLSECLVLTHVEKNLRFSFYRAGRGEVDLSKIGFDPENKLPVYDGKDYDENDQDAAEEPSYLFQFFRYGVDQRVSYLFVDKPLTDEQKEDDRERQEHEKEFKAELEAKTKEYMENHHDPDNPDPFQKLWFLLDNMNM